MIKTLKQLNRGEIALIKEIRGGRSVRQRLGRLGLHPTDKIRVIQNGFFGGPILIEIHGIEVGIGRGMAEQIEVETGESS
jgi:ferrous iron transport protein A